MFAAFHQMKSKRTIEVAFCFGVLFSEPPFVARLLQVTPKGMFHDPVKSKLDRFQC